jgi:hypothetical protein
MRGGHRAAPAARPGGNPSRPGGRAGSGPTGARPPGPPGPPGPSRTRGADPFAGVERVLVDGTNLAFALAGRGAGAPTPAAGVLASVRAAFPATVRVELVFDGSGDVGIARAGTFARAAQNLFVEHSGRRSADRVIEDAVEAQLRADGPAGTWGVLVVSDDRELRGIVQAKGARVAGTAWLAGRLGRDTSGGPGRSSGGPGRASGRRVAGPAPSAGPSGTSIGHRRPPRPPRERC